LEASKINRDKNSKKAKSAPWRKPKLQYIQPAFPPS
jgi:hypothetical protein